MCFASLSTTAKELLRERLVECGWKVEMEKPLQSLFATEILAEFSKDEFAAAKVDPIYQFSKPITGGEDALS
ncbi:hypothetical protein BUALT_Bualt01G0140300 [Buddleja alternifolia]|uniref:Uncharacterized protein n=1 Tax=Buddleja alternifolia TaxID=168488 RepID=A0AAV6Y700_9LAMI|nr:hypothetical protein BUALT_Bualt01G0140300 [Buddleja alternifolia]